MTLIEQLRAVRARIEKGWTQQWFYKKDGQNLDSSKRHLADCCCLLGACIMESGEIPCKRSQVEEYIHEYIHETYGCNIPTWNDRRERTKQDVLDLLDLLIERVARSMC